MDLVYKRDALVTSLSRGMTQRLGLARVLLHDPQVLLLDEPASGLDPRARIEMRELIKRLRRENKTIMVSSHILPELADICNKLGIIERGKLLFNGTVAEAEAEVRKVKGERMFLVSVGERNADAVKKLVTSKEVASAAVDPKLNVVRVAHETGVRRRQFHSRTPHRRQIQAVELSRGRNRHRRRVPHDHEGDYKLVFSLQFSVFS